MLAIWFLFLRIVGALAGVGLYGFLAGVVVGKRNKQPREWLAFSAALAASIWLLALLLNLFLPLLTGAAAPIPHSWAAAVLIAGLATLLHWSTTWTAAPAWCGFFAYAICFLAIWRVDAAVTVALVLSAALLGLAAERSANAASRSFFRVFALSLAFAATAATGWLAFALAPGVVVVWFVRRRNALGLLIRRRLVVAVGLSLLLPPYLLLLRNVAIYAEEEFPVFGPLLEVALFAAAAGLTFPLYSWIMRRETRRLEQLAALSRRIVIEATGILALKDRAEFFARRIAQDFELSQAVIDLAPTPPFADPELDFVFDANATFNYVFPLRYEDRLIGLLRVATAPRLFLDEREAPLTALAAQIAQSLETCRIVEVGIERERAMLRQEHLATLGTLAASIAHELKNPLSSIKTLVSVMSESPSLDDRTRTDLSFIRAEIDRLNNCLEQLLTFARPRPREGPRITVASLLGSTADALTRDYASNSIRVECSIDPAAAPCELDYQSIQQVLWNLALNAVQASSAGATVLIEAAIDAAGRLLLTVTDDGPGIPPEARERVFEPFYSTKPKGTGLGLAIVAKNVRHLGGELRLDSPVHDGRGTRAAVLLPAP